MKLLRWCVWSALGVWLLAALLLLGRGPLAFRAAAWWEGRAPATQAGMRLLIYEGPDRQGKGRIRYSPGPFARMERAGMSLEAYGVWRVPVSGRYTLGLRGDDRMAVYLDGHRVLGVVGRSASPVGRTSFALDAGPHLLVVHLSGTPAPPWFELALEAPGGGSAPGWTLTPIRHRLVSQTWRLAVRLLPWVGGLAFWVTPGALALAGLAMAGARTPGQAAVNALLVAGSVVIAVVAGELAVRLLVAPPPRVSFRFTGTPPIAAGPVRRSDVMMIPTERGFRHNPNAEVVVLDSPHSPGVPIVYRTNSIGYRNPEIGPKSGQRILFLGDSITFGLGINEPDTFVRRVEVLARAEGRRWETVNAGVNGLGMNGELAVLSESGLALHPDQVVLGFYLNDFLESPGIYITRLPGLLDRSWLAHQVVDIASPHLRLTLSEREGLDSPPMLKAPDEVFAWREEFRRRPTTAGPDGRLGTEARTFDEAVLTAFEDWGGAFSPEAWPPMETLLAEFSRLARERGFRFAIVAFPVRPQVEAGPLFDYPQRRMAAAARSLEVPYLDLLPLLRAEHRRTPTGGPSLFLDHCHLTPRGNEVVARAVLRFLADSGAASSSPGATLKRLHG